jgi:aspartyl-tRNA(Asn)/glutamyl-tRNA(Gln) amidotransferase subunit A
MGWPSITVPFGLNGEGLPLGMQVVSAAFGEQSLFETARWLERQLEPMPAPPPASAPQAEQIVE